MDKGRLVLVEVVAEQDLAMEVLLHDVSRNGLYTEQYCPAYTRVERAATLAQAFLKKYPQGIDGTQETN